MIRRLSKKMPSKRAVRRSVLIITIKLLINAFSVQACAQTAASQRWPVLEAGLKQKSGTQRVAAVRVLGLIPDDPHATELAEQALKDKSSAVRVAAATSLDKMHATGAGASLRLQT